MKLFLANDTSTAPHAGCKAVMRSLRAAVAGVPGLEVAGTHFVGTAEVDAAAFAQADIVMINGEGTIHHSGHRALFLMAMIDKAKRQGKRVLLVNALFQQYECSSDDLLAGLALLTVREPRSAAFARRYGGQAQLLLDSAADPAFLAAGVALRLKDGIVIGGAHKDGLLERPFAGLQGDRLRMGDADFEDIVATLRNAEIYLTGQHHGVYAAALAGCPFVATPSNSHKIEAFIEWTGLPIPICLRHDEIRPAMAFVLRNRTMFADLQDFMARQSVLTSAMIAEALR
ncbi:MAG: polysaccharide pyruvyl transferase family protein [Pseudomonadota bacterium]